MQNNYAPHILTAKVNLSGIPKGSRLVYDSDINDRLTYRNDSANPFSRAWVVLNLSEATNGEYFEMHEATVEPAEQATVKLAKPLVGVGRRAFIRYLIGVEVVAIIIFVFAVGLLISAASGTDSFVRYFLYFCYLGCAAFIVFLVVLSQILHFHRVRNMGYNGWWSMLMYIPFVGVGVTIACAILPTSFRINKRLDKAGMIGLAVIVGLFIAANICFAIVVVSTPKPTPAPAPTEYTAADYGMNPQEYERAVAALPPGFVIDPPPHNETVEEFWADVQTRRMKPPAPAATPTPNYDKDPIRASNEKALRKLGIQ